MKPAVYVAAPYELKEHAAAAAKALKARGHAITSGWHDRADDEAEETARRDLEELEACDVFLMLNPSAWTHMGTGGRHVEYGYALARGKDLAIIGVASNLFHRFEKVRVIASIEEL